LARARFVSSYGNYSYGVQSAVHEHFGTGESRTLKRRIDAQFHRGNVTDDDLAFAVATFSFPGLPHNEETNTNISPRYRVSVWDSEWSKEFDGFSDEEIDLIVDTLRRGEGTDHREMTIPAAGVPFPSYDELSVGEILQVVKITSIDPQSVLAYERENANREDLIAKLEGKAVDDDVVVVQA
jgi:hypothetical protein